MNLEDYMFPCLNKKFFGVDCLGCGIQRAFILVIQGDFITAFKMYPAIYTLLLVGVLIVINFFFNFRYAQKIISILAIINVIIIVLGYVIKMKELI